MTENQSNVQTNVQQVDVDIDSWLGAPGADTMITPTKEEAKPNLFSKTTQDLSFLDTPSKKEEDEEDDKLVSKEQAKEILNDILDKDIATEEDDFEDNKSKAGRPRTEKSGLVEFLKKRIESKEMFAFDDYDEKKQSLDDYLSSLSEKDVDELWKANIENLKDEVANQTPAEFFKSLPEELQYAAKYVADGGQDLKGLFQALAQTEQVRDLDPNDDYDQELIVRNYLQARGEDPDDIDEEILTLRELGSLGKKAKQFKPKLDAMQEEIVQTQLAEQEQRRQQQEQAAQAYVQNVFEALRPGEINGVKLDKKTQAFLYSGLTQPQYPSVSGRPTNLLGHLLEKYQYVEPNYSLIAEALWLLSNPDEYRNNLMRQGKNDAVAQTVRQLKTEQARKNPSTYNEEEEPKSRKISRPQNIFKR
jgi:hypothetical protein